MGPEPLDGNLEHHVGLEDGALCVVDKWSSKDPADRFAATRLYPAFAAAGVDPPTGRPSSASTPPAATDRSGGSSSRRSRPTGTSTR